MASGRPPGPHPAAGHNDELLLDESAPMYNSGQRPPVNDDHLLRQYDIDDSETPHPRPSVSYDQFVGGQVPPQSGAHAMPAHPPTQAGVYMTDPYSGADMSRTYSQTSG
ncbi:hypothetical protein AbraIFM66950_004263, partial [Aspergillus brasiliensis]